MNIVPTEDSCDLCKNHFGYNDPEDSTTTYTIPYRYLAEGEIENGAYTLNGNVVSEEEFRKVFPFSL